MRRSSTYRTNAVGLRKAAEKTVEQKLYSAHEIMANQLMKCTRISKYTLSPISCLQTYNSVIFAIIH